MNDRLRQAEDDIETYKRLGERMTESNFNLEMVENASVPTGEQTVQLLRSMSTYINSSMHLKENQIAKEALSKLALEQRADHKIVNKLTKDVEHIKL